MLSAISGGERTKDTIDHLTNPVCDKFAPRRSTNWGPEPLMPAFCGTGRIFSFHKLLFMHLDCRVLAASGCPCLSCWRNMAKLRYGLTYIFLDNDLHFLENHSRLPGRRRNSPLTLRAGMHGGAVMRIGPTFTAVVAITLVAAADVHSDGSGLAEQAASKAIGSTEAARASAGAAAGDGATWGGEPAIDGARATGRRPAQSFSRHSGDGARRPGGLHHPRQERSQQRR